MRFAPELHPREGSGGRRVGSVDDLNSAILKRFRELMPGAFTDRYSSVVPEVLAREAAAVARSFVAERSFAVRREQIAIESVVRAARRLAARTFAAKPSAVCPEYVRQAVREYERIQAEKEKAA